MTGLVVMGGSRSGTSMTTGLFGVHGVWFGDCAGPTRINAKGFWENKALKRVYKGQERAGDFPAWWEEQRQREGYSGGVWGAKCGAERWGKYWFNVPDVSVIVQCYRDEASIQASRREAKFKNLPQVVKRSRAMMDNIRASVSIPCFKVWTPNFISGDFSEIIPAFDALGIEFDEAKARDWVDPSLWHGKS